MLVRPRLAAAAAVAAGVLMALPAAAAGSTVTVQQGLDGLSLTYSADSGEANVLTITRDASGAYQIDDAASVTITALPPACSATANHASCSGAGVKMVLVSLGDGDDRFTMSDTAYPVPAAQTPLFAEGADGDDTLTGASGPDGLSGGPGADHVFGGGGADSLAGGDGDDTVDGGEGDDAAVSGGGGSDTVLGGPGDDQGITGGEGADTVDGGDGADDLQGEAGADTVAGGPGDDRLDVELGPLADAADGSDALDGGPGDDTLGAGITPGPVPGGVRPAQGPDTLSGGDGLDTADFSQRTAPLAISLDGAANDGEAGEGDDVRPDVERVTGGAAGDVLTGSAGPDTLDGAGGEDTVSGGDGDDTLSGGANDPSNDDVNGGAGDDTLAGGPGDDRLDGGPGADRGSGGGGTDTVLGDEGGDVLAGGAGADRVDGGDGDDWLNGSDANLIGADGGDDLAGGAGSDALFGGPGDDRLDGGPGPDYMSGQTETDTVTYRDRTDPVTVTLDGVANDGEAGEGDNVQPDVELILGGIVGDDLTGDADANTVDGGRGEDLIDGSLGPDRLVGGDASDVVLARDGVPDQVACEGGGDLAITDAADRTIECETVDRPGARRLVAGRYAVARPRGRFGLRLPRGHRYFPLSERVKVPVGSSFDPRGGVLRMATARNRAGASEVAAVSAGRFTLRQRRGRRPVTEFRLAGRLPDCGGAARARAARRPARRLRVDVRTRRSAGYRVRGRFSLAGSVGTAWVTEDRCDGTLTRVIHGTVRVRDLGRGKTVTVRAGRRYLARAR